eukprot:356827-Chlamydomonas_euryale.AAC.1
MQPKCQPVDNSGHGTDRAGKGYKFQPGKNARTQWKTEKTCRLESFRGHVHGGCAGAQEWQTGRQRTRREGSGSRRGESLSGLRAGSWSWEGAWRA